MLFSACVGVTHKFGRLLLEVLLIDYKVAGLKFKPAMTTKVREMWATTAEPMQTAQNGVTGMRSNTVDYNVSILGA